jgi:hypothetical protein
LRSTGTRDITAIPAIGGLEPRASICSQNPVHSVPRSLHNIPDASVLDIAWLISDTITCRVRTVYTTDAGGGVG